MKYKLQLNPKLFLKNFGLNLILTNISLALLFLLFRETLILVFSTSLIYKIVQENLKFIGILIVIINHLIYRKEYRESNNYIGRCLNDSILILSFLFVIQLFNLYNDPSYSVPNLPFWSVIFLTILIFLLIIIFETLVAFLKYVLKLVKIDIL